MIRERSKVVIEKKQEVDNLIKLSDYKYNIKKDRKILIYNQTKLSLKGDRFFVIGDESKVNGIYKSKETDCGLMLFRDINNKDLIKSDIIIKNTEQIFYLKMNKNKELKIYERFSKSIESSESSDDKVQFYNINVWGKNKKEHKGQRLSLLSGNDELKKMNLEMDILKKTLSDVYLEIEEKDERLFKFNEMMYTRKTNPDKNNNSKKIFKTYHLTFNIINLVKNNNDRQLCVFDTNDMINNEWLVDESIIKIPQDNSYSISMIGKGKNLFQFYIKRISSVLEINGSHFSGVLDSEDIFMVEFLGDSKRHDIKNNKLEIKYTINISSI